MNMFPKLLEILDLQQEEDHVFKAKTLDIGSPQVYGGQVLAQSVVAANRSIGEDRDLHSLHGYFLSPGNCDLPIYYHVQDIKDGRSFSTRRVAARQKDRTIFIAAASYHIREEGVDHQATMPNVTQPGSLNSFPDLFAQFAEEFNVKPRGIFSEDSPILFYPVEHYDPFRPGKRPARSHAWFKANGKVVDDLRLNQVILAYASDFNLLITSLLPHDMSFFLTPMRIASLDHAMWFHRPMKTDEWMLYVVESPNAYGARAFCTGRIYTKEGILIASVTQEGLIRKL